MILRTLEASKFVLLPEHIQDALSRSGVIPVNDIFLPNWHNTHPINIYYGSYGSGKSVDIVDEFIYKCYNDEYFRCFYGRRFMQHVRGTIFQTIIDRIKELHLTKYFKYSEASNGTMDIICIKNGNAFYPFGCSDAESLKGIKDPSHILVDEVDQITFKDFGFLYSRLRTKKAVTQFYGACNTEHVYKSHWIRAILFDGVYKDKAFKLKANYTDNYFIDQEEYLETKLKLLANGNEAVLNSIARGEWGAVRTGSEFWKSFDELKHVKPDIKVTKNPIHISLDENVNPYITQTIWQVYFEERQIKQVHEILSESPYNNAPKAARQMAEWLFSIDFKDVLYIYGDPSARRRSTVDENSASFYDKYIEVLRSYGFVVESRVAKSAPEVALSAAFINMIYESGYMGWTIEIANTCFQSIEDYILVKENADGTMAKPKTKDEDTKIQYEAQGHISDAKRYFIIKVLEALFNEFKSRKKKLYAK